MYFADLITLMKITYTQNADGYCVSEIASQRDVFAEQHSLARGEFYGASQSGIEAVVAFKVRAEDFFGEIYLKHNGNIYKIARAYDTGKGFVDLTCTNAKGAF